MLRRHTGQRYFDESQEDQRLRVGLVGYWVGTGSGLTLHDRSGYGNHGTLTNGPLWTLGREGIASALVFDGVDDFVLASSFTWPTGGPITVAFWNYVVGGILDDSGAFTIGNLGTPNRCLAHAPWPDGVLYWDYGTDDAGRISTSYAASLDRWTHIALASAGNGGAYKAIYLNGVPRAVSTAASAGPNQSLAGLWIGAWSPHYHRGQISDVRIYNRVLSDSEIARLADPSRRITAMGRRGRLVPVSVIKTRDGLARSSVKTWNGLADASVKKWDGIF